MTLFHNFLLLFFFFFFKFLSLVHWNLRCFVSQIVYIIVYQIGKRSWKLTYHVHRYILVHASFILVFVPVFLKKKKRDCASPFQRLSLEFIVGIRRRATLISIYSTKVWSLGRFFSIYLKTPLSVIGSTRWTQVSKSVRSFNFLKRLLQLQIKFS